MRPRLPFTTYRHRRCLLRTGTLLLLVAVAGCGRSDGPMLELSPLTGSVTIDGAPADGVSLTFLPDGGAAGNGGWAVTDAAGHFIAKQYSGDDGLPAGNYLVQFSRLRMPDGSPIPEGKDAADVGAVESMPRHLSRPDWSSSPYLVTIPTGQDAAFNLSTRR